MKNPLVSVLVHTKNSGRTIREHLESIKKQTYKNIEIVVVDNNSIDNTVEIAREFTRKIYNFGPERSAQRNYAAKKSFGEYYLVPDSDMILEKNVVKQCVEKIIKNHKLKAIVIPEKSKGKGFFARCKELERSFYLGIPWMEGARFFSKEIFWEMRGYKEKNTGTEDYDLPQRIKLKYGEDSIGRISTFIYHDEGNLSLLGLLKKKFYYAQDLDEYKRYNLIYYHQQANIIKRFRLFFSDPSQLFNDPLLGCGVIFMKIFEFIAGGLGYILSKIRRIDFSHS